MATVWLSRRDCIEGTLPRVCLRCGQSAEQVVEQDFFGTLVWRKPFTWLLGVVWGHERATFRVPMCDRHRNHWRNRWWIILVAVVVALLPMPLTIGWWITDDPNLAGPGGFGLPTELAVVLGCAVSAIALLALHYAYCTEGIRGLEVHEDGVGLANVHQKFLDAQQKQEFLAGIDLEDVRSRPIRRRADDVTRRDGGPP